MINTDRIVPVTKTDLVTLYGNIMTLAGSTVAALEATAPGVFKVVEAPQSGSLLAAEPVKALDIDGEVSAVTIYFLAAYDFEGFTVGGTAATIADGSDEVEADDASLYSATLATGEITISKIGF